MVKKLKTKKQRKKNRNKTKKKKKNSSTMKEFFIFYFCDVFLFSGRYYSWQRSELVQRYRHVGILHVSILIESNSSRLAASSISFYNEIYRLYKALWIQYDEAIIFWPLGADHFIVCLFFTKIRLLSLRVIFILMNIPKVLIRCFKYYRFFWIVENFHLKSNPSGSSMKANEKGWRQV